MLDFKNILGLCQYSEVFACGDAYLISTSLKSVGVLSPLVIFIHHNDGSSKKEYRYELNINLNYHYD